MKILDTIGNKNIHANTGLFSYFNFFNTVYLNLFIDDYLILNYNQCGFTAVVISIESRAIGEILPRNETQTDNFKPKSYNSLFNNLPWSSNISTAGINCDELRIASTCRSWWQSVPNNDTIFCLIIPIARL